MTLHQGQEYLRERRRVLGPLQVWRCLPRCHCRRKVHSEGAKNKKKGLGTRRGGSGHAQWGARGDGSPKETTNSRKIRQGRSFWITLRRAEEEIMWSQSHLLSKKQRTKVPREAEFPRGYTRWSGGRAEISPASPQSTIIPDLGHPTLGLCPCSSEELQYLRSGIWGGHSCRSLPCVPLQTVSFCPESFCNLLS